jgi:hypothetical protein
MRINGQVTHISAGLLVVVGMMLGGCTSYSPVERVPISGQKPAAQFNTGRVMLYVSDFSGRPLAKAMVNVEGANNSEDYFRTAALSDVLGRVSFHGLPQQLRISVYHAETQGNYSRVFNVPSSGVTELRMLVEPE